MPPLRKLEKIFVLTFKPKTKDLLHNLRLLNIAVESEEDLVQQLEFDAYIRKDDAWLDLEEKWINTEGE